MTRMKDSGIEWIGEVPEEWEICRIKDIYSFFTGTTPDTGKTEFYGDENGSTWITISDMQEKYVSSSKQTLSELFITSKLPMQSPRDSLLYSFKLSVGKVSFAQQDLYTNEAIATFLATDKVCLRFLYYSSFLIEFNAEVNIYGAKILNRQRINNAIIINPPLLEQTQIADFLDKKVAQLDKVKSLLEEQIKTLEDYRQSLIYETVTKGLDKTVPLKDSGVEWIGQIPEGWEVGRLKDFVKFQTGTTPPQSVGVNQDESGIPWFKPGDFSDNSIDLLSSENHITHEVVMQYNLSVYPKKTILLVGIASIGKVGYSAQPSYSNQQITALRTIGEIYPRYLAYLMFSSGRFIKETALYTVVPIINNQYLATMRLVLPSENEQKIIVEYLDRKLEQINQMIAIKKEQIENINKQRQTLIYDYVTGKRRI